MKRFLLLALLLIGAVPATDGRHDFDFEIGTWNMQPSGDRHVVQKLWDGATIARLEVSRPAPHVRGSLLKLYEPKTKEWSIYWADARDGTLSPPLAGHFTNGRGTFTGIDTSGGRRVLIRLVFFDITATAFKTVQSTSSDGGKTWSHEVRDVYERVVSR